ncbi:MAG: uroporphyrinogen decarboxylase family protein [Verrucomicrobiota bacterium]|jgi:uroporphyrinogen decarboxylase
MTSLDRIRCAARRQPVDRVPVAPYMGNLDPVELLWRGSAAAVNCAATQDIMDTGGRGFILGSGCEVPMEAPRENIKAMILAAHDSGWNQKQLCGGGPRAMLGP